MKKLLLIAGCAALAACGQSEDAARNDTTIADATAPASTPASWTGFEPGNYTVTQADGAKLDVTLKDDGTYTMTDSAGKVIAGTLVMKDGKGCFTPEGGTEMCWTNAAPGSDGSFSATADDGAKVMVAKKAA